MPWTLSIEVLTRSSTSRALGSPILPSSTPRNREAAWMGWRMSWLMAARNWDLARLARSASTLAAASSCSVCFSAVMSVEMPQT